MTQIRLSDYIDYSEVSETVLYKLEVMMNRVNQQLITDVSEIKKYSDRAKVLASKNSGLVTKYNKLCKKYNKLQEKLKKTLDIPAVLNVVNGPKSKLVSYICKKAEDQDKLIEELELYKEKVNECKFKLSLFDKREIKFIRESLINCKNDFINFNLKIESLFNDQLVIKENEMIVKNNEINNVTNELNFTKNQLINKENELIKFNDKIKELLNKEGDYINNEKDLIENNKIKTKELVNLRKDITFLKENFKDFNLLINQLILSNRTKIEKQSILIEKYRGIKEAYMNLKKNQEKDLNK
ncbi:hypothetical protein HERIO_75 [Hepatospora eriocheir]|uniref:Uncharacterized protein n=1 Tax=Hepatospora eriocheir TaxID=1081669 RepID=A0A1X0QE31_9MICR|nr:hypothetical protein HERIO_75 [Hepatospora eriocheir]